MNEIPHLFDAETWQQLPTYLDHLPEPVRLVVWGDKTADPGEKGAAVLCQTLAGRFDQIHFQMLPRRANYPFYPVIGVMGENEGEEEYTDFGARFIGLPVGYQMTSLITAVQAVSFRGMTLAPLTRIKLRKLPAAVRIELLTAAENEVGSLMAKIAFGLAAASSRVRAYLIMADMFPEAAVRYSAHSLPHTVINGRVHIEGVVDEDVMMEHMAVAVK